MAVAEAAFDIDENQGKEGGQARVENHQYKNKERVKSIGCVECMSHKELFLATVGETRTATSRVGHRLRQPKSSK